MSALNFHHLAYFRAVAHEGNLTRAAEKLHVSQSAVSVQIRKLERRLGHDLFERRNRSLILTEAGRIALDHADAIFSIGDDLVGTLSDVGRERVVLRVGSLATLSRNFQVAFLDRLFGRDDVEIVARSGSFQDLLRQLEAHQLDVILTNWVPPRDAGTRWVAHAMADQEVGLIGHPDAREANAGETGPVTEDRLRTLLSEAPLVLPTPESSMRVGFDALLDRLGVVPKIAAEADDMALLRLLARKGIGRAVIPPIVVRDELASGELAELAPLEDLHETFWAITMSRRFPNPLLRELIGEGRTEAVG